MDFSSSVVYTVTAQDGTTSRAYTVTVTVLTGPPAYITAFCPHKDSSTADGGETWVDVRVSDAAAFSALGSWKIKCGTHKYVNELMSSADLGSWSLVNGDTIRIHEDSWTGSTDSVKSDNNGDK